MGRPHRLVLRLAVAAGISLAGIVAAAMPAAAVQTATFGIAPAKDAPQQAGQLAASVRPGQPTGDDVTVWNRTAHELTLDLSVVAAHLGPDGHPVLGGDPRPATWVHLGQSVVTLAPHGQQTIAVNVVTPRRLPHLPASAAIIATPEHASAAPVSVVVRLGVMVSITAAGGAPLRAPLGMIGWVALGLLLAAGLGAAIRGVTRRAARGRSAAAWQPRLA
ncbi:MAG TPA: hypothetical protein VFA11_10260 [Acidimicrobiales bacterium]|nr:hypothetical protein [Acidimicrobiales bacterium]